MEHRRLRNALIARVSLRRSSFTIRAKITLESCTITNGPVHRSGNFVLIRICTHFLNTCICFEANRIFHIVDLISAVFDFVPGSFHVNTKDQMPLNIPNEITCIFAYLLEKVPTNTWYPYSPGIKINQLPKHIIGLSCFVRYICRYRIYERKQDSFCHIEVNNQ